MKRALITGSAGFVGRHFTAYLAARGFELLTLDIRRHPDQDAREFFRLGSTGKFDLVVHAAAIVGGRKLIDGAPLALASNLELDAGLFQWALRNRPGRILYFSSSAAYPLHFQRQTARQRLYEDFIDPSFAGPVAGVPDQLYGWTKLTGENLAYRARQEGLNVTVVRPFSGYGTDQDPSYPFPAFIARAASREDPFDVWGSGEQARDFIHIEDIVRASYGMVNLGMDGPVNLGTGRAVTMRELAVMVTSAAGYSPAIRLVPGTPEGAAYRVCDPSLLREFYEPRVSLEEGIDRALRARRVR
jgi:nucleoside-diphosphate-sugar epimerase